MKDRLTNAQWSRALFAGTVRVLRRQSLNKWLAATNIVLVIALAYLCARLIWVWLEPASFTDETVSFSAGSSKSSFAGSPDQAALTQFDPFHRQLTGTGSRQQAGSERDNGVAVRETKLELQLFGVRADGRQSGEGSAIIRTPDKRQIAVQTGGTIMDGVVLRQVHADHVVIERQGVLESLYLADEQVRRRQQERLRMQQGASDVTPARGQDGAPAQALAEAPLQLAKPSAPSEVETEMRPPHREITINRKDVAANAADVLAQLRLRPKIDGGRLDGFYVEPRGDLRLFQRTGLEPGDVLLSINGRKIRTPDMIADMANGLEGATHLRVGLERAGRRQSLIITLDE